MNEREINIFIDEVKNYFDKLSGDEVVIGTPYPKSDDELLIYEFTGLIGISGGRRGCLYISTSAGLLRQVAKLILRQDDVGDEILLDISGELANTVAGNAQAASEHSFDISPPIRFQGSLEEIKFNGDSMPVFAVPFSWHAEKGVMIVGWQ